MKYILLELVEIVLHSKGSLNSLCIAKLPLASSKRFGKDGCIDMMVEGFEGVVNNYRVPDAFMQHGPDHSNHSVKKVGAVDNVDRPEPQWQIVLKLTDY